MWELDRKALWRRGGGYKRIQGHRTLSAHYCTLLWSKKEPKDKGTSSGQVLPLLQTHTEQPTAHQAPSSGGVLVP